MTEITSEITLIGNDFDERLHDGIGRYSHELYKNMLRLGYEPYAISVDDLFKNPILNNIPKIRYFYRIYKRLTVGRKKVKNVKAEILHLMSPEQSIVVGKTQAKAICTTWHDNMLLTRYTKGLKYKVINKYQIYGAYRAYKISDAIISVSSQTQQEMQDYFKQKGLYDDTKIYKVISHGVDNIFLNKEPYKDDRTDFVYIGAINYSHKNLDGLLEAFSDILLRDTRQNLHIFTSTNNAQKILEEALSHFIDERMYKQVILHYKASDEEIIEYTRKAVALLHLSMEEGFGLPILEAMALGTPVITLEVAKIPEEVRKYAYKEADYLKVVDRADKLINANKPLSKEAIDYAKSFTWERTAKETAEFYNYVLGQVHINKIKMLNW